jgi:DNA helicase IV
MERESEAKDKLKAIRDELKDALMETDIYKSVFEATLKQASEKCKVPEKVAAAHAIKVVLANYKKEKEEEE